MGKNNAVIDQAIQILELQKDLAQLTQQSVMLAGAIQYLRQKISSLEKNGQQPDKDESPAETKA